MDYTIYTIGVEGLRKEQIENLLSQYLEKYYPKHLIKPQKLDVEHLLTIGLYKSNGFKIEIVKSLEDNVEGDTMPFKKTIRFPKKIYNGLIKGNPRDRFTGCHEAVHAILHEKQITENIEEILKLSFVKEKPIFKNPEWQANYGAGVLLMPKQTLIPFVEKMKKLGKSEKDIIKKISKTYGVSDQAASTRYSKLNELIKKDVFME